MTPIKAKDLIEEFCVSRGYKQEDIELIIQECYDEIKTQMTLMEHDYLRIPVFGDLFLKVWTLKRQIDKKKGIAENALLSVYAAEGLVKEATDLQVIYDRVAANFYARKTAEVSRKSKRRAMKLRELLSLAWENRDKIADGFYHNYLSHSKEIKKEIDTRRKLCEQNSCGYYDKDGNPETSAIPGKPACSACHCNIELKTACLSCHCSLQERGLEPLWEEITTNEMDKHIGQIEWENQFKPKQ